MYVNDCIYTLDNFHDDHGQHIVTFYPGVTRVFLDTQIIDQVEASERKYSWLIINDDLLPNGVIIQHPSKASLIIMDNCKCHHHECN